MKFTVCVLAVLLCFCLSGCMEQPVETTPPPQTTLLPTEPPTIPTTVETTVATTVPLVTGWVEENGCRYYYDEEGVPVTGWLELDGRS